MPRAAKPRDDSPSFSECRDRETEHVSSNVQPVGNSVTVVSQKSEVVCQTGDEVKGAVFAAEAKRWIEGGQRGAVVFSL